LSPVELPVDGLTDGGVRLRLVAEADLPAIVVAAQDPEIPRWTRVPSPYGEEDAREWQRSSAAGQEAGTDLHLLIVDAEDDRLLGAIGMHEISRQRGTCTVGYWLAAEARGRGVATRALRLLCEFAFEQLEVVRIELAVDPGNAASIGVAERAGFRREGLLRSFIEIKGKRRDVLMYSLLPTDAR
jgi:ribosomal-protein-alanine N-acetyltransferase